MYIKRKMEARRRLGPPHLGFAVQATVGYARPGVPRAVSFRVESRARSHDRLARESRCGGSNEQSGGAGAPPLASETKLYIAGLTVVVQALSPQFIVS